MSSGLYLKALIIYMSKLKIIKDNKMKKMTSKQEQCYNKAMKAFGDVFQMICNVNDPISSVDEQGKVIRIIQDTKDKINELIDKKL